MVHVRRTLNWALVAAVALPLAACGGDDGDEDGADDTVEAVPDAAPDSPSTDVTVAVPDDPCALLSDESVASIAGGPTDPEVRDSAYGDDFGPSVRCSWTNDDFLPPVEVTVTGNREVFDYARGLVEDLGGIESEPVSGIGDDAFTFDEGSGVLELVVLVEDQVVQVRAATDDRAELASLASEVIINLS